MRNSNEWVSLWLLDLEIRADKEVKRGYGFLIVFNSSFLPGQNSMVWGLGCYYHHCIWSLFDSECTRVTHSDWAWTPSRLEENRSVRIWGSIEHKPECPCNGELNVPGNGYLLCLTVRHLFIYFKLGATLSCVHDIYL